MTERWRREMGKLGGVEPSPGLWERATEGPTPDPPPSHRSAAVAVIVAFALVAAGTFGVWKAFAPGSPRSSRRVTPADTGDGYYIRFPETVPPAADPNGGAVVSVDTNLPERTLISIAYKEVGPGGGGGGFGCCSAVKDGQVTENADDQGCYSPPGAVVSSGFTVTFTASPVFPQREGPARPPGISPSPDLAQPASVLEVLGSDFANLTGDQVQTVGDHKELVATQTFDWPEGVCQGTRDSMVPVTCSSSGATDGNLQFDTVREAAENITSVFAQVRLCELYDDMSHDWQNAHPWSTTRDDWLHWVDGLGSLAGSNGKFTDLTVEVVDQSADGMQATADVLLRGRRVAQIHVVQLPDPHVQGLAGHLWRYDRLDLY
jgi:hypothetical protein